MTLYRPVLGDQKTRHIWSGFYSIIYCINDGYLDSRIIDIFNKLLNRYIIAL